jgi:hypothetical protein
MRFDGVWSGAAAGVIEVKCGVIHVIMFFDHVIEELKVPSIT